jgi:orotate phosphoribosyltransferase
MSARLDFIRFALAAQVLRFGHFQTKAGRQSPYFFNAGLFHDGTQLGRLAAFYAQRLIAAERAGELAFDMVFGPAYKGITLASSTAIALAQAGRNVPFAFNRKEAKDHGEGGTLIGAPLKGRVVIIDDVISAGTSIRESVHLIRQHGATPAGVLIALDRQERGGTAEAPSALSATQEIQERYGIPVLSIASLDDVLSYLDPQSTLQPDDPAQAALRSHWPAIMAYRNQYGSTNCPPPHVD